MPRCIIRDCYYHASTNYLRDKKSVNLFSFPANRERRETWILACNIKEEDIHKDPRICHLHFTDNCLDKEKSPFKMHLKENAVPTENLPTLQPMVASEKILPNQISPLLKKQKPLSEVQHYDDLSKLRHSHEYCAIPSTSTGFCEDNQSILRKSHSSLGFCQLKTPPSSPKSRNQQRNPNPEPTPSTSSENNDSNFIEDKNEVKDNVEEFKVENEVKDNVEESSSYDHNCIKAYQIKKGEDICEVNVKMEPIYTEENYCDIPVSEDSKIKRELDTDDISTAVTSKRVKLENGIEIKQENPQESLDTNFFVKIETEEIQIKDENIQIKEENIQ